jgi:nitrile hydratase subunit alpha
MSELFKYDDEREAASAAKVRALEALLIDQGYGGFLPVRG